MPKPERTIKIKLLVQYCGPRGSFTPGTIMDLPEGEARGLLDGRHAVPAADEQAPTPAREIRGGSRAQADGDDTTERREADDDIDDIGTVTEASDDDEARDGGDESIDDEPPASSKPAAPKPRGGKRR